MSSRRTTQPALTSDAALRAVMRMTEIDEGEQADLSRFSTRVTEREDVDDSPTPVFDAFHNNGPDSVLRSTNFSEREFNALWYAICDHVNRHWNVGRGSRSPYGGKDLLFMTLCALKNGGAWDFLANMFNITGPSFERMIVCYLDIIEPFLYETFVTKE